MRYENEMNTVGYVYLFVFATHSPVRLNLIAVSRCKILSINENVIEIDEIDAYDRTPVIDLKN